MVVADNSLETRMKRLNWLGGVVALALIASAPVRGEEPKKEESKPVEKPAVIVKKEKPAKPARLTKPWSEMADLTDEQKASINDIHRKALDEKKAIDAKEKEDILALLTDAQKAEVEKLTERKTAEKKKEVPKKEEPQKEEKPAQ